MEPVCINVTGMRQGVWRCQGEKRALLNAFAKSLHIKNLKYLLSPPHPVSVPLAM